MLRANRSCGYFTLFSLAVLLANVPVVGRQLTLEALIGWAGATLVLLALPRHSPATRLTLAGTALVSAYALAQFKPGQDPGTHALNWIPFQGQVGTLVGMSDILETLWPFMAIGLGLRWLTPWRWRRNVMLAAMDGYFPPGVDWTHPEGGLFLWATLPEAL